MHALLNKTVTVIDEYYICVDRHWTDDKDKAVHFFPGIVIDVKTIYDDYTYDRKGKPYDVATVMKNGKIKHIGIGWLKEINNFIEENKIFIDIIETIDRFKLN